MKKLEARHYKAIYYLSQPNHGGLTMEEIAKECGVSRKSLYEWKKSELFQRELKKEIRRTVGDRIPEVIDAMFREAIENGSGKHAELLLKTYGDMLTDKIEVEVDQTVNDKREVRDAEALQRKADELLRRFNKDERKEDDAQD
ncbi:phBC6A51 family helix-turn-helix protein [Melghirimyces algeriensis]|uniref:Helix-turn-helix of insertion element transposase n=1 Tax=Melghirimyces algeriensis TaxID=910412 RepID=A0A521F9L8_9BACL|nr:phBC6A51 family helix-turn-helix protein [Melghirimyces algeriensis]SMO92817.1 Helix-turn-helix of insertion element transposase [Melghirimyces algeriensis]